MIDPMFQATTVTPQDSGAIQSLQEYNAYLEFVKSAVAIFGQECLVFVPTSKKFYGYEDLQEEQIQELGTDIKTSYKAYRLKMYIDFILRRSVMYHFNYFPEDADNQCTAFAAPNDVIIPGSFIRTRGIENVSTWGDIILQVMTIKDDGKYKTLNRIYFLKPVNSLELNQLLSPMRYQNIEVIA